MVVVGLWLSGLFRNFDQFFKVTPEELVKKEAEKRSRYLVGFAGTGDLAPDWRELIRSLRPLPEEAGWEVDPWELDLGELATVLPREQFDHTSVFAMRAAIQLQDRPSEILNSLRRLDIADLSPAEQDFSIWLFQYIVEEARFPLKGYSFRQLQPFVNHPDPFFRRLGIVLAYGAFPDELIDDEEKVNRASPYRPDVWISFFRQFAHESDPDVMQAVIVAVEASHGEDCRAYLEELRENEVVQSNPSLFEQIRERLQRRY